MKVVEDERKRTVSEKNARKFLEGKQQEATEKMETFEYFRKEAYAEKTKHFAAADLGGFMEAYGSPKNVRVKRDKTTGAPKDALAIVKAIGGHDENVETKYLNTLRLKQLQEKNELMKQKNKLKMKKNKAAVAADNASEAEESQA